MILISFYKAIHNRALSVLILMAFLSGCGQVVSTSSVNPTFIPPNTASIDNLGSTKISPADNMTMVYVPAGEFIMGSEVGLTDEQPAHAVYLDSFWLDKTEVTIAMYSECVRVGKCDTPNLIGSYEDSNNSMVYYEDQGYANHPVAFVSWKDARAYCTWAGRRLPTEAEWEKAATWDATKNMKYVYPWGDDFDCSKGNFDDETELDASLMPNTPVGCDGFARSAPVGSYPQGASPYGALDMGGNVWEWVNDAFIETDPFTDSQNYYEISPASNPPGVDPTITEYRVMRGGSWNFTFGFGRASYRLWYGLSDSYDGVGFRCASSE